VSSMSDVIAENERLRLFTRVSSVLFLHSLCRTTMSCSWECNRRFGIAHAMHYRLKWFTHASTGSRPISKGREHPTNTSHGVWTVLLTFSIYLFIYLTTKDPGVTNMSKRDYSTSTVL